MSNTLYKTLSAHYERRRGIGQGRASGFTLIEVMVVVVILGILASIVVPRVMDNPHKARVAKAKADIKAMESAMQMYALEYFDYPKTDQGLEALVNPQPAPGSNVAPSKFMDRIPTDPWNNPYQYLYPGTRGEVDIFSFGRDGRLGGENEDADIGNWSE
ncbi:MAG: type II secretion system major pseudopilin GspG [Pseudomonadota bacterium]